MVYSTKYEVVFYYWCWVCAVCLVHRTEVDQTAGTPVQAVCQTRLLGAIAIGQDYWEEKILVSMWAPLAGTSNFFPTLLSDVLAAIMMYVSGVSGGLRVSPVLQVLV